MTSRHTFVRAMGLAITAVLAIAACSPAPVTAPSSAPAQATQSPTPAPVTITWWGIPLGLVKVSGLESETANPGDWERLMAKKFSASHPNVTINYQLIAAQDITEKMTAAVLGNQPPDIYLDAGLRQSKWATEPGLVENIKTLVDAKTLASVNPVFLPSFTATNGVLYALPVLENPTGWQMYNKAIFDDLGISAPTDGAWSYKEFEAVLAKAAVAGKRWPLAIRLADEQADTAWLGFFLGFGCRPFSADFTKSTMGTPQCERALAWLADANARNWVYPGAATIAFGDLDTAWASGQTVFARFGFVDGPARVKTFQDQGKATVKLESAIALFPHDDGVNSPGLIIQGSGLQVFAQSNAYKRQMIGEFLAFLSQADNQRPAAKAAQMISAFSAVGNPNQGDKTWDTLDSWVNKYGVIDIGQTLPKYTAIRQARVPLIQAAFLGKMTPAAALAEVDKQVNALLASR